MITIHNDIHSVKSIDKVEFAVLGNDEIKRISVMGEDSNGIEAIDLYDNSEPRRGSLIDPRMGPISNNMLCANCGLKSECPGHSGHINLAEYVFHIGFRNYVQKIMSCICFNCSKLLIHTNEIDIIDVLKTKNPKERLSYIKDATKNINYCQKSNFGCGSPKPKFKIEIKKTSGMTAIVSEFEMKMENDQVDAIVKSGEFVKQKVKFSLNAESIYEIFKNISDDDVRIMGFDPTKTRPEDLIQRVLYVAPVQIRPSTRGDYNGGMGDEDDLTHQYSKIVKHNMRILKNRENQTTSNIKYRQDYAALLQIHVANLLDNEDSAYARAEIKGRPIKSFASRIKGKTGRIRGNLMGKRVNYTARTVITSDPSLRNDQLRVPVSIAKTLTFPETVTPQNIDRLREFVKRGRDNYPGANRVFKSSRRGPIDLRHDTEGVQLEYGDVVERHLMSGDIVLLNRQPTLHKQSMMAFYAKVVNDPSLMTFGMSVDVCKSFNADFDGDLILILSPTASCL